MESNRNPSPPPTPSTKISYCIEYRFIYRIDLYLRIRGDTYSFIVPPGSLVESTPHGVAKSTIPGQLNNKTVINNTSRCRISSALCALNIRTTATGGVTGIHVYSVRYLRVTDSVCASGGNDIIPNPGLHTSVCLARLAIFWEPQ